MSEAEVVEHHEVNCLTGEVTRTPLVDEEIAEMSSIADANEKRAAQEAADETALRQAVAGHQDPVVKALAARLGF